MSSLLLIFATVSSTLNLPIGLLSALCFTESSHRPYVVHKDDGNEDSLGECQIQYTTAKHLGYKGTKKDLMKPYINVYWAGKYLHTQIERYDGDLRKAVSAYNMGTHKENANGLTINRKYVSKVFAAWAEDR